MIEKKVVFLVSIVVVIVFFLSSNIGSELAISKEPSITSSKDCRECHVEIYDHWKNAMHSMSLEDPIFMASYMESYFNTAGQAKFNCLRCHAPVVLTNNDFDLNNEITKEGVSCNFCHSIKKVNLNNKDNPFELEIGDIKRGPLSNVDSPAHRTEPSSLFKSSELCSGCHEYTNDEGVSILGTYSEWKESSYAAEGTQCQNCHMPLIPGRIVEPKIKTSRYKQINLHAISASRSTEQLTKAVKVDIKSVNRDGDVIEVVVGVTNLGSGHMVPTGIPARRLILYVELRAGNKHFIQERVYQRILADESGKEIKKECEVFLQAAEISFDNRIKPRETRIERFAFAKPRSNTVTITARVEYLYRTRVLSPTEMRVKMAEDTRTIHK